MNGPTCMTKDAKESVGVAIFLSHLDSSTITMLTDSFVWVIVSSIRTNRA